MDRRGEKRGALEIVFLCTVLLLIGWFSGAMDLFCPELPPGGDRQMTLGFAGLILLFLLVFSRVRFPGALFRKESRANRAREKEILYLILLAVLAIVPRMAWRIAVPPSRESDYGLYVRLGEEFARNGWIQPDDYLLAIAPNAAVFAAVLGWVMRVFVPGAATAQNFCLALHVGNIFLLDALGRRVTSRRRAFLAAAVFAVLPENVFYSTLPGIEALSLFTLLLGLLLVMISRRSRAGSAEPQQGPSRTAHGIRQGDGACLAAAFAGGLLLAFSACVRPSAWAAVAASVFLLLRRGCGAAGFRGRLLSLLFFALGIAAVLLWHSGFQGWIFGGARPSSGIGWPLYEGLDLESGGRWTEEKSRRCIEVITANPPAEANRIFLEEALERYRGYTLAEKIRLFFRKGGVLWYDSRYSVFSLEGTDRLREANNIATLSWTVCLAAWIACLICRGITRSRFLRGSARTGCAACLIIILLTAFWHEAGTSIGRYHYMLIPFVLLSLAVLLPEMGSAKRNRGLRKTAHKGKHL